MENVIDIELETPENIDLGSLSYLLKAFDTLYNKIVIIAEGDHNALLSLPSPTQFITERDKLSVLTISKQSPIKISLGSSIPKAIDALSRLIPILATLPELKFQRRLENQSQLIDITLRVVSELQPNMSEAETIALAYQLLPTVTKLRKSDVKIKLSNP